MTAQAVAERRRTESPVRRRAGVQVGKWSLRSIALIYLGALVVLLAAMPVMAIAGVTAAVARTPATALMPTKPRSAADAPRKVGLWSLIYGGYRAVRAS